MISKIDKKYRQKEKTLQSQGENLRNGGLPQTLRLQKS